MEYNWVRCGPFWPSKSWYPDAAVVATVVSASYHAEWCHQIWILWKYWGFWCGDGTAVKLWHTKLDRENRFQTSRVQNKLKPKTKRRVRVSRFCSLRLSQAVSRWHTHTLCALAGLSQRSRWPTPFGTQKLSEFLWDEQTGFQSS